MAEFATRINRQRQKSLRFFLYVVSMADQVAVYFGRTVEFYVEPFPKAK